jgi:hypothetical protein
MAGCFQTACRFYVFLPILIMYSGVKSFLFEMIGEKIAESQTVAENTADPNRPSDNKQDDKPEAEKTPMQNKLSALVNVLANVTKYIGIVIVIFGIFRFVISFRCYDPEMTSQAIMTLVVGAIMSGCAVLLPNLLGS